MRWRWRRLASSASAHLPHSPEWGLILADALPYVERAPLAVLTPAASLALMSVLGVSLASLARR